MRALIGCIAVVLAGCAAGSTTQLSAADAATTLIAGAQLTMTMQAAPGAPAGEDPLVIMKLQRADGRAMAFEERNHAPNDLRAQAAGGPLAQIMGLFGDEAPILYAARAGENTGAPFICGPDGAALLGVYTAPDGAVLILGLKQGFEFETLPSGEEQALPYSPDQVCARLRFSR